MEHDGSSILTHRQAGDKNLLTLALDKDTLRSRTLTMRAHVRRNSTEAGDDVRASGRVTTRERRRLQA